MEEKVNKLLDLTGNEELFKKMRDEYLKQLNESLVDDPEMFEEVMCLIINDFKYATFRQGSFDNYMEMYSEEEISFMLEFYGSEMGQQIIEKNSVMVSRSMTLAKRMANQILEKLDNQLK